MSDDYGKHTSSHDPITVPADIYTSRISALQTENARLETERDQVMIRAERLAVELRKILVHGSAGNENLIRKALTEWEAQ